MALGKAFIEVHADTKPFARELGRELDKIVKAADKDVKVSARKVGETITKETGEGVKKGGKKLRKDLDDAVSGSSSFGAVGRFATGIIDTLDDGLSGLPGEIKAVLGAALVAAIPLIISFAGALGAALTAALSIGATVGIAALLGAQFVEVREGWQNTLARMRDSALGATTFLAGPILDALNQVEVRFNSIVPAIAEIAKIGSTLFKPIVDSVFGLVDQALPGLISGFSNLKRFMLPLQVGLRNIGNAVGQFFDEILSDPQAANAFYDILVFVEDLVRAFTAVIKVSLQFYRVLRTIGEQLGLIDPVATELKGLVEEYNLAGPAAVDMGNAVDGTIAPLEGQAEAVENVNTELQTYTNLMFDSIANQIEFQEQIDKLSESVKENGKSLDIGTEAGRENAKILLALAQNAIKTRDTQIALTGDVENSQIEFEKQRKAIYDSAKQMGLSEAATKNLIGALLLIPPPVATGPDQGSINRLNAYYQKLLDLQKFQSAFGNVLSIGIKALGAQAHASGGVFSSPHLGMVAEAGPEAIIPLNNPTRAAQVMNEAGLSGLNRQPINVYVGNDQLASYIDDRVNSAMRSTARSLSYGMRTA